MSHSHFLNDYVLRILPENLSSLTILDVGCGFGEWGFLIRTRKSGWAFLIGIDVFHPYLEKVCRLKIYDELVQVKAPILPFKTESVDISLACEILEHMPKKEGLKLIEELERITKQEIIISTPLNWPQDKIWDNPYEKHVAEWSVKDLTKRGYEVKIVRTLPKTLETADRIRRFLARASPTPKLLVAYKKLA
ncbi:MAG: class I SAM-dependent methyltransferase [Candidatus Bathycorpusculaceae bacterium]